MHNRQDLGISLNYSRRVSQNWLLDCSFRTLATYDTNLVSLAWQDRCVQDEGDRLPAHSGPAAMSSCLRIQSWR